VEWQPRPTVRWNERYEDCSMNSHNNERSAVGMTTSRGRIARRVTAPESGGSGYTDPFTIRKNKLIRNVPSDSAIPINKDEWDFWYDVEKWESLIKNQF
jgi:hypothetical protein